MTKPGSPSSSTPPGDASRAGAKPLANAARPEFRSDVRADRPETRPPTPLSIGLLDDDEDFLQYLKSVLEAAGHEVRASSTPEAFFEACEARLPELVLLDMKMGTASGEDVLREIRKRWSKLCVIVVTGYPSLDSMRETFKQDVFDYLSKPFSIPELHRSLAQAAATLGLGQRPLDRLRTELGRQVKLARIEKAWTLKELSEASHVSVSQLSSIERGAHLPSLESLLVIAAALGVKPSSWLEAAGQ
ncbi:MAG: response regulator [Planctomycetota bacterium]|nr:response regulator [Planctomycetota bacterium]